MVSRMETSNNRILTDQSAALDAGSEGLVITLKLGNPCIMLFVIMKCMRRV